MGNLGTDKLKPKVPTNLGKPALRCPGHDFSESLTLCGALYLQSMSLTDFSHSYALSAKQALGLRLGFQKNAKHAISNRLWKVWFKGLSVTEKFVTEWDTEPSFRAPVSNQEAHQLPSTTSLFHGTTQSCWQQSQLVHLPSSALHNHWALNPRGTTWHHGCKATTVCKEQISIALIN